MYAELLDELEAAGVEWVQLDEPAFVQDRSPRELDALGRAYDRLGQVPARPRLLVSSYFDHLGDALGVLAGAPVDGIGLDLTRDGARNLDLLAAAGGIGDRTLVAGVVDGRNVWVNDLERSLSTLATLLGLAGEVVVSTSCSLQHVPIDLDAEQALDPEIRPWLAFARQKVAEVVTLARGLAEGTGAIAEELEANQRTLAGRRRSGRTHDPAVRRRLDAIGEPELRRASPYEVREKAQRAGSACRRCPPPPSAPSPRPARSARPRRPAAGASWTRPATRRACATRSPRSSGSRTSWSSTCWSTGSPSATTWSSTSGSSSTGWP